MGLLGGLFGLLGSTIPTLLGMFQSYQDRKHEIKMIGIQTESQLKVESIKLEAAHIDAQIRESESLKAHDSVLISHAAPWAATLSATVRPLITYFIFLLYFITSIGAGFEWISQETYEIIWNQWAEGLFSAIAMYWFGSRALEKIANKAR